MVQQYRPSRIGEGPERERSFGRETAAGDSGTRKRDSGEHRTELSGIEPAIRTLFNPLNWFAADQVDLRRRRAQLRETGNQKAAERQSNVDRMGDTLARIGKVKSNLQRHSTFDLPRRKNNAHQIAQTISGKQEEQTVVTDRIRRDHDMVAQLRGIGNQKIAQKTVKCGGAGRYLRTIGEGDKCSSTASNVRLRPATKRDCRRSNRALRKRKTSWQLPLTANGELMKCSNRS